MPTITQEMVQGYAHCRDNWCPGNEQEPVAAIRERCDVTYAEKGGLDPVPGIENTTFRIKFADMATDATCAHCGKEREISDQPRPVYPQTARVIEGQGDQRFLLGLIKAGKITVPGGDGASTPTGENAELEALRREVAEMRGFLNGQQGGALREAGDPTPSGENATNTGAPPARRRRKPEEAS